MALFEGQASVRTKRGRAWAVRTSLFVVCLSSSAHGFSQLPFTRLDPFLKRCSLTSSSSQATAVFGARRSSQSNRMHSPGLYNSKALFGHHGLSRAQPTLLSISVGSLDKQTTRPWNAVQIPAKRQTQLNVLADICDEERDYREADISGTRLFVTGLPASVDDVRLYLAFEEYGRVLEAQVAKPGLGFVVFEDANTADEALAGMEGEEISGKEIRVKRARSFYIRKEEEARLRLAQAQRERETRTAALAEEHSRRVRVMEEAAYTQSQGLSSHVKTFDMRGQRRLVLEEMRQEGLLDFSTPLPYRPTPQTLDAKPVRPGGAETGVQGGKARSPSPARREVPRYIEEEGMNGRDLRDQMRAGAAEQGGPDFSCSQAEEERIKRQAMIEIMKEGDKLTKEPESELLSINIAQLIRERVEQIKRYEMLRDNREMLSNITFTSSPTQNVRTTGVNGYTIAPPQDKDDDVSVTDEEEALVRLIDEDRGGGAAAKGTKAATTVTKGKRKRGRPRKNAAQKTNGYVPTGRPRGRPRKKVS